MKVKIRQKRDKENYYQSVFINGQTLRGSTHSDGKTINPIPFPEFYDVAINDWCSAGCSYCYTDAKKTGKHFDNIIEKIDHFFGRMNDNQKPFQVALGGAGEPTAHPDFINVLKRFDYYNIVPNYTTNGLHLEEDVLQATKQYCGGVALSLHPHLEKKWKQAIELFNQWGIKTNVHIIISDKQSIDYFLDVMSEYQNKVDYFVLLPYMTFGRAANKSIDYSYLNQVLDKMDPNHLNQLAFGSNFYDFLVTINKKIPVSLYPPEIFSKYIILDDPIKIYNNSFEMEEIGLQDYHLPLVAHLDNVEYFFKKDVELNKSSYKI